MSTQKNRLFAAFIVPFLLFFWSSTGWAALYVSTSGSDITGTGGQSNPFATIQHSADVAPNGETIFVSQGIYNENININKKNLNLYGGYNASDWSRNIKTNETIIDGRASGSVLYIRDSDIVFDGFIVQNGQAAAMGGGGIDIRGGTPKIKNCIMRKNKAVGVNQWGGGAILIGFVDTMITIENCRIIENFSEGGAGGIRIGSSSGVMIKNTLVADNIGAAGTHFNSSTGSIINSTIVKNPEGGFGFYQSQISVQNCIEWYNDENNWGNLDNISYSNIEGGNPGTGNINQIPGFVDANNMDYRLQAGSPCIDAGNPDIAFNDIDETRNDMGVYGGPDGISYSYPDGPPIVEDVSSYPEALYPGETVNILCHALDLVSSVASVQAEILTKDGTLVGTVSLFDDGQHNDGSAGDNFFGNTWTTPIGENLYNTNIIITDANSNSATYTDEEDFFTQTVYDQFETKSLNESKWGLEYYVDSRWNESTGGEMVREISNGKLRLNVQGIDQRSTMETRIKENNLSYLGATVLVESDSYVSDGAYAKASLSGYFHNDGTGDCWTEIAIKLNDDNSLHSECWVEDPSKNALFFKTFQTPVTADSQYDLSIELSGSQIIFKCNNETQIYTIQTPVNPPSEKFMRLMSRVYADPGEQGYFKARFDDIYSRPFGGQTISLYDDFESNILDPAKWDEKEIIREVVEGKLRIGIRGVEERAELYNENEWYTPYYAAKVMVESGSYFSPGAFGSTLIGCKLYNDSRGPGSGQPYNDNEGEVWTAIFLIMDDSGNLVAKAYAERINDAYWSSRTILFDEEFQTSINLDQEYALSLERKDSKILFRCNDELKEYPITTPIYRLPEGRWRGLDTRVYADSGEHGYIKARFDDVAITRFSIVQGEVDLSDVITALQILSGVTPQAVLKQTDINNNARVGLEEVVYILQKVSGVR